MKFNLSTDIRRLCGELIQNQKRKENYLQENYHVDMILYMYVYIFIYLYSYLYSYVSYRSYFAINVNRTESGFSLSDSGSEYMVNLRPVRMDRPEIFGIRIQEIRS